MQPALFVPPGKRLVIEHVSASGVNNVTGSYLRFQVDTTANGANASHFLVTENLGSIFYRASQDMRAYADSGTQVQALVLRGNNGAMAVAQLTISGYYVDAP